MELTPDAWHQNDQGEYYLDCPECGSAATVMNVVKHGRCNGYLDQQEDETELDEEDMTCTARLALELVWDSDPGPDERDEAVADEADAGDEGGSPSTPEGGDPGTEGEAEADPETEALRSSQSSEGVASDADGERPADSDES